MIIEHPIVTCRYWTSNVSSPSISYQYNSLGMSVVRNPSCTPRLLQLQWIKQQQKKMKTEINFYTKAEIWSKQRLGKKRKKREAGKKGKARTSLIFLWWNGRHIKRKYIFVLAREWHFRRVCNGSRQHIHAGIQSTSKSLPGLLSELSLIHFLYSQSSWAKIYILRT